MKSILKFNMGSSVFFKDINGYIQKDYDELHIVDELFTDKTNVLNLKKDGKDIFFFRNLDKEGFIKDTLESKVSMRVGKFLIPDFCNYIGFTIEDYERLKPCFEQLDDKHKYEKLIRDAYIANNAFVITEKQLLEAYQEYKKYR